MLRDLDIAALATQLDQGSHHNGESALSVGAEFDFDHDSFHLKPSRGSSIPRSLASALGLGCLCPATPDSIGPVISLIRIQRVTSYIQQLVLLRSCSQQSDLDRPVQRIPNYVEIALSSNRPRHLIKLNADLVGPLICPTVLHFR